MIHPLDDYTSDKLCDYEISLLKYLVTGEDQGLFWGAAMSVSIESLRAMGYVSGYTDIKPTEKGVDYISTLYRAS